VAVPPPVLYLVPVLDCLDRAKVETGATDFTAVLPYRLAIDQITIMYRAYDSTNTAGCATYICKEVLVCIMDLLYKSVIHKPFRETRQ
jgi:hypothetical protein